MSKQKRLSIALLMRDTLQRLGLEWQIRQLSERPFIDHFNSFKEFSAIRPEAYDLLFIDSDLYALHHLQLQSATTRVVTILNGAVPYDEGDRPFLHPKMEGEEIRSRLINYIEENERTNPNSVEKALSQREVDVLKEVARGMTNKEIADRLNISMNTVMSHRKNITAKLNIRTVSGLTFYALMNGLISGEEVVKHASE